LDPVDPDDPSHISLELKALSTDNSLPAYCALSYSWGEAQFTESIVINHQRFHITPSLSEAILHARRHAKSMPLWIDQICVDQKCIEERNVQVTLMGVIYRRAEQVLIWLGPAADGSDELMDGFALAGEKCFGDGVDKLLVRDRLRDFVKWTKGQEADLQPPRRPFRELCEEIVPLLDAQQLKAWFLRPWFHRVWVVQEYCLAKEPVYICGDKFVSSEKVKCAWVSWNISPIELRVAGTPKWTGTFPQGLSKEAQQKREEILKADAAWMARLKLLQELHDLNPLSPLTIARARKQMSDKGTGRGYSFLEVLKTFGTGSRRKASNPRDWIYGLMAMPSDLDKLNVTPDYGLTCESVFTRFTRSVVKAGNLEILRFSQYPKSFDSKFPSWVPDWQEYPRTTFDYQDEKDPFHSHSHEPKYLFHASGDTSTFVDDLGDERILGLRGFFVDEIEELGSPLIDDRTDPTPNRTAVLSLLANIKLMCLISESRNNTIYSSEQRRAEGPWRIPIADIEHVVGPTIIQYNARATSKSLTAFRHVLDFEQRHQERAFVSAEDRAVTSNMIKREESNGATQYRSAMATLQKKRPFLTTLGYVGLGPMFARAGDKVVVFQGAAIPFVVRPAGDERYHLLGEAYCDGIMDGEIVNQREAETIALC
jgi:hypothetical protein